MTPAETNGNGIKTLSNQTDRQVIEEIWRLQHQIIGALAGLGMQAEHHDTVLHGVTQFIDEHRPLLSRFTDPGAAVRAFLPGGKRKGNGNG